MLGADRVQQSGGSPAEQLAMLGDELLDVIARYPDHVWVFLHEFPALTGDNATEFRARRHEYESRVEGCSWPASSRATSASSIRSSPRERGWACTTTRTCG